MKLKLWSFKDAVLTKGVCYCSRIMCCVWEWSGCVHECPAPPQWGGCPWYDYNATPTHTWMDGGGNCSASEWVPLINRHSRVIRHQSDWVDSRRGWAGGCCHRKCYWACSDYTMPDPNLPRRQNCQHKCIQRCALCVCVGVLCVCVGVSLGSEESVYMTWSLKPHYLLLVNCDCVCITLCDCVQLSMILVWCLIIDWLFHGTIWPTILTY